MQKTFRYFCKDNEAEQLSTPFLRAFAALRETFFTHFGKNIWQSV